MARVKLQTTGLQMEYYQPRTGRKLLALDDVNVSVEEGEFVAFVGPSGCGKTTFINIVDGLLKNTGGRVILDGKVVQGPGRDRAMVFQDPCLLPWGTVLKNVIYGMECQGQSGREVKEKALHFIELVGLSGFEEHYTHELSGGMQQRVNLARALTVDPEVLIMDEPFAALDAQTREIMQQELLRIWRAAQKTVLFITHQINEAIYLADRVIIFTARPGRVKAVLKVDIDRPRPLRVKREKKFLEYEDQVWGFLEEEVRKTMLKDSLVQNAEE